MIVADASAVLELLLRTTGGLMVGQRFTEDEAAAPELLDAEVFHRLVSLEKASVLTPSQTEDRIQDLRGMPVVRLPHGGLLTAARRYAAATSGYDALYLATAGLLAATLVTADVGLARTATEQFGLAAMTVPTTGRPRRQ